MLRMPLQGLLAPAEAQQAAAALEENPGLAPAVMPASAALPLLVAHNAGLASQLLLALLPSSPQASLLLYFCILMMQTKAPR